MSHPVRILALSLAAAALAAATGCNTEPEAKRCIDFADHVLPYTECTLPVKAVKVPGSINLLSSHRYYYGGYGGNDLGAKAWGGSERPLTGHVYEAAGGDTALIQRTVNDSPQPYSVGTPH